MALFRRRPREDVEPVGPDYRSPQLGIRAGDLQVLGVLIDHGADLTEPRHVLHFLYLPDQRRAEAAAEVAGGHGWECDVREPLPDSNDWCVVCERHGLVLDPETVRHSSDLFEAIAERQQGAYDGWEASV